MLDRHIVHRVAAPLLAAFLCTASLASGQEAPAANDNALLDSLIRLQQYDSALPLAADLFRMAYTTHGIEHASSVAALTRMCRVLSAVGDPLWLELAPHLVDVTRRVHGSDDPRTAEALSRYGILLSRKKGLDEGRPVLEEAVAMIEKHKDSDPATYARILQTWGHYNRWRDQKKSVDVQRQALEVRRQILAAPHIDLATNLLWLGFTEFHDGDHQQGLRHLEEAEEQLDALGLTDIWQRGTIAGVRGEAFVLQRQWDDAERAFQRCARQHERVHDRYPPGFGALPKHGYNLLPHVQLELDRPLEAWQSVQRYREQTTLDHLLLRTLRGDNPEEAAQLRRLGVRYLEAHRKRVDIPPTADDFWPALLAELDAKIAVDLRRLHLVRDLRQGAPDLATLQARLDARTAYVGWVIEKYGDYHSRSPGPLVSTAWAYVIRHRGPIQWIPLHEGWSAEDRFDRLIHPFRMVWPQLDDWGMRLQDDPRLRANAQSMGSRIFGPLEPHLDGIDQLVVEYSGSLLDFPIEILMDTQSRYYGDRFAITYAPCARAYVHMTRPRTTEPTPRALAVGDPLFTVAHEDLALVDRHEFRTSAATLDQLPRLLHSGDEVRGVARHFPGSTVLAGRQASKQRILESLAPRASASFDMLHFATHALVDPGTPEQSMLVFSRVGDQRFSQYEGVLDSREITYGLWTDVDLVTLSACRTASGQAWRGEPRGFMQAWFAAGTRSLLASTWRADDEAASLLMQRFYENLSGNYREDRGYGAGVRLTKIEALAEARRAVRHHKAPDGSQPFAHPFYWAGFTLIGAPQ